MALTLNAEQKSIYHIFSGEIQYVIPPYQRAYSWREIHCRKLFEDVKKAFYNEEKEGYFLGNIVLAKSRENRNSLEVIDGQQRLTSLILLIKVLLYFDKDNKALYSSIWIKDRRTDNEAQRLQTDIFMEQDYNYFKEVLAFDFDMDVCESISKKDNLFKQNICYFFNEIKEFKKHNDISKFSDFLLDYVYLLPIETEDSNAEKARKNALQVFETVNNRGINLSTSDIFKARLYSMALNELEHDKFVEQWRELNKKCNKLNYTIDNIFKNYSYMFKKKEGIFDKKINLREFFLENKYSPFVDKQYSEIMNDLLKICDFILFFMDIMKNPNKNQELSKWFQLIHQGITIGLLDERIFYKSLYSNKFNLNHTFLIDISKKMICSNFSFQEEAKIDKKRNLLNIFSKYNFSLNDSFFMLLGLTLDKEEKAINPYLTFNNDITSYLNSFTEIIPIETIQVFINLINQIYKGVNIGMDNLMINGEVYHKILIIFIPKLKDDEKCIELINRAYQFIRECNEN